MMCGRIACLAILACFGTAGASNDVIVNVAQPLVGYAVGVGIGYEGYAGYGISHWEAMIDLTCAENSTRVLGGAQGRGVLTADRNAASIVGLTLRPVPKVALPGGPYEPFFGDTLRVALVVPPSAIALEEGRGWVNVVAATLRDVVCATIECARINAATIRLGNRQPKLRYLAVEIEGWDDGADMARTYPLDGVAPVHVGLTDCE